MKKGIVFIVCLTLLMSLCACHNNNAINTHKVESEIYSQEDINAAINVIIEEFTKEWEGCTLTEIYYAGDEESLNHQKVADDYEADYAIVLLSSFDVDSSGGDGSLNANDTYVDWNWILVRKEDGQWEHVDHGY